ncbi:MAG: hypothetical protein U9O96_00305 [Candidatus Thermoplasmatota archaeon]|nr:hypothetical protein [Candidatus Thermoplasmatota archaeon]
MNNLNLGVFMDEGKSYFGHCLYPEHENYHASLAGIWGYEDWFYCPICKIKWSGGSNLISIPDDIDKEEYLMECEERLSDYQDFNGKEIDYSEILRVQP